MRKNYIPNTNTIAYANIKGSKEYPNISGKVIFQQMNNGTLVTAEIFGLPFQANLNEIYGFHIHEGSSCTGDNNDYFSDTKNHFDKENLAHPCHTGDMPPLFGNNGYAYMSFFTNKFLITDIVGKTVVIHKNVDDFKSQPSGNSGIKIACGVILKK